MSNEKENQNIQETTSVEVNEVNETENYNLFNQAYLKIVELSTSDHPFVVVARTQWSKFRSLEDSQQMMAFSFVFVCLMAFGLLDNLIFGFICLCYPTWATLTSVTPESVKFKNDSSSQWAVYWIVFSWLSIFEYYLPLYNIPYYTVVKTLALFVCFMPKPNTISKLTEKYSLTNQLVEVCGPYLEKVESLFSFLRMADISLSKEKEDENAKKDN